MRRTPNALQAEALTWLGRAAELAGEQYRRGVAWKDQHPVCAYLFHRKMMDLLALERVAFWRLRVAFHRAAARRWLARSEAMGARVPVALEIGFAETV